MFLNNFEHYIILLPNIGTFIILLPHLANDLPINR